MTSGNIDEIIKSIEKMGEDIEKRHKAKREADDDPGPFKNDQDRKEQIRRWRYVEQYRNWF